MSRLVLFAAVGIAMFARPLGSPSATAAEAAAAAWERLLAAEGYRARSAPQQRGGLVIVEVERNGRAFLLVLDPTGTEVLGLRALPVPPPPPRPAPTALAHD